MSAFDRNFGSIATAREFWGGNNGFVTLAVQMPDVNTHLPVGTAYTTAVANLKADAYTNTRTEAQRNADLLLVANAERNQFRVAQACGQRAVVVAVSAMDEVTATDTVDAFATTPAGNVLASGKSGASSVAASSSLPMFYVTFMIERADVYNALSSKPGSTYALSSNPAEELAQNIQSTNMFASADFQASPTGDVRVGSFKTAASVGVKVFDNLPVLK